MTDVSSRVGVEFTATGDAQVIKSLNEVAASGTTAETSLKGVTAAHTRLAEEARKATGSSKAMQQATLGLSRQFTDIGVQLAGGQNPFLVLTQQLPQIADQFAVSKQQGLGFKDVVRGIGGALAPFAGILGAVGLAVGAAAAGFGLFERAVDKQTKYATTFGDTWKATLKVVGDRIMDGPIGDGLKFLGGAVNKTLDAITDGFTGALDFVVGQWGSAYQLIVNNWRRLPEVMGVLAQGAANNVIRAIEGLINASIKGLNVLLKGAGLGTIGLIDLPEIRLANKKLTAEFDSTAKSISASFKKAREGLGDDIAKQADKEFLARQKVKKGAADHAKAAKDEADAVAKAAEEGLAFAAALRTEAAEMGLGTRELKQRNIALAELVAIANGLPQVAEEIRKAGEDWLRAFDAEEAKKGIKELEDALDDYLGGLKDVKVETKDVAQDLADAFTKVRFSIDDMFRSIKSGDIGSLLLNVRDLATGIPALLAQGPAGYAQIGSLAANAIGGRTGRAVGGGLGIAAGVYGLGSLAGAGSAVLGGAGVLGGVFGGGAAAGGLLGGLGGALGAFAAAAGPIAIAAGALYAAAKLFNVGGKPTNAGAGFDLRTGAISGNKRTSETEDAARAAGEAIQGIQAALKAAGIGITDAVTGLVIGTRDQTQIYLESGRTLRSAVGDSGAAVDAALAALVEGATYVSEAQKKLVESAVATGKGFDAVAEVLAKYESAQGIGAGLADEIMRLKSVSAGTADYDLAQVRKGIDEQRKAASALATEGYLTAEQLAGINAQLEILQGLQIDEVMKRYAVAVDTATNAANDNLTAAAEARDNAESVLRDAYQREADAINARADQFRALASSLRTFEESLRPNIGAQGGYNVARAAFLRTRDLAATGDVKALGALQGVSEAYLAAARSVAPDARAYARDLAAVRNAVQSSATAAEAQVSQAEAQLAALREQVGALIKIDATLATVAEAITGLSNAAFSLAVEQGRATQTPEERAGGIAPPAKPAAPTVTNDPAAVAAIERQNELLAEQNRLLAEIAKSGSKTADTLVRTTRDGEGFVIAAA